jgi:integrase
MGLLIECPSCKKRLGVKKAFCSCGVKLGKASGKVYWIEYYGANGRRARERIGPNKAAAEQRLRDLLKARAEERYIQKDPAGKVSLGEIGRWYLALAKVKAKASYGRDQDLIKNVLDRIGAETKIRELTVGRIESYQQQRLQEPSPRHPGKTIRPSTVNKEIVCIKTALNRAVRDGKLEFNPIEKAQRLPENNVRERVLSQDEFETLLAACPGHLAPLVLLAYYAGMRRSEITLLTWDEVDLKNGFIRLAAGRTKTKAARVIPLHPRAKEMLEGLPRAIQNDRVFLRDGKPFNEFKHSYDSACEAAGLVDFTFHDLRHCALNNLRLAGNDFFKIMAVSGHKTMAVFKRYNLVTEEELGTVKWPDEPNEAGGIDTYMDTK